MGLGGITRALRSTVSQLKKDVNLIRVLLVHILINSYTIQNQNAFMKGVLPYQ